MIAEDFHPCVNKIKSLLADSGVWFETFTHEPVRTSEEAALVRPEYSIAQGAKALIIRVKLKGETKTKQKTFAQVVVPGDAKFDPKKVRRFLKAKDTRFATPEEVAVITDGVVPGGVPPFGNLFGLTVLADEKIFNNEKMIFNAGDRRYSIGMKTADYRAVVKPLVADIID